MTAIAKRRLFCTICAAAIAPGLASAATITTWDTANVVVGPADLPDGETGFSVIYDRDLGGVDPLISGATSNGRIAYSEPEATSPGLRVENDAYELGGPAPKDVASGCIMASSDSTCDGPFQSGKRFKQQLTGIGEVDLVFGVDVTTDPVDQDGVLSVDAPVGYQVYHRLVNLTGQSIESFSIQLGSGIGDNFVASSAGDGLSFSAAFTSGPEDLNAFSQYPFGLFGDASTNPNFTIDGFFDTQRTGFDLDMTEDLITSGDMYGSYSDTFGAWMSQEMAPDGLFWDFDGDPTTDALLLAWQTPDGAWEVRREATTTCTDPADLTTCSYGTTLDSYTTFADVAGAADFLGLSLAGGEVETGLIEDLANLNENYAIMVDDTYQKDRFTVRVSTVATVAAVPLPATAPLLIAGLGAMGFARRRRRQS
jgi:hypothetical protein